MTLPEKAGFVILRAQGRTENINAGIPSLCIPPLTLSDGPNGIANKVSDVTQLPAAIGVAASFNPAVARATGEVLGAEARTKGFDVAQGPELNLARVPQSGRIFETFGEDPYLTTVLGVANVDGIQSAGVMADAKHFTGYTQETARIRLDQVVPLRALAELYDAPFAVAVTQGHVASVMCSYGSLNGVNDCSSPYTYTRLRAWGFAGFVRSDLHAVRNPAKAFGAGMSLIKPGSAASLVELVRTRKLPVADLNRAVALVLSQMFAFGMIARPFKGTLATPAETPAHRAVALRAAEAGVVLLKDEGGVLPLSGVRSVAVIGSPASTQPTTTGGGSSRVTAPFVVTPLAALRASLGKKVRVTYSQGGPASLDLDQLSDSDIVSGTPLPLETKAPASGEPGKSDLSIDSSPNVSAAVATANMPGRGEGWSHWRLVLRARRTGIYEVSMQQIGDTWLYLNGRELLASRGLHTRTTWATTVPLQAGRRYTFTADWFSVLHHGLPQFGIVDTSPQIEAAVAAARKAQVAIVFAGDPSTEGADQPNLSLGGNSNALIAAVASANPNTIVVLNTGGAVLMPWLNHVAGVIEAWYPGEEDGTAIAAILTGAVDPSGRLPITFPATESAQPVSQNYLFPGVDSVVSYGSGLEIGYRWYQANGVAPLFPFGFGLDYTTFTFSSPTLQTTSAGFAVRVTVQNSGPRPGTDVVQAYVHYPASTGEPPEQLRAFARVTLAPLASETITLAVPSSAFEIFSGTSFETVPGRYDIDVGQSSADLAVHLPVTLP
ncbi:MAG TPA: glycoside hydrolase family 3 C-terminal domain-containing protein [Acidimicrobiales bacterium]|nr:glycoside hydrolase family 3 C-terminal domain-containing protein [Acidimicrobiales bacterium]